ncbi:MAG: ATP-dependent helicase [Deltaproteobacteria bacterium]|nr:ATP-dependent helicase [Deltaproteobacteria bacterium]
MTGVIKGEETYELNGEQKRAVNHGEGPLLIIAGAGTGKTRVITHRIAKLVERGVNPSDILALTFTEKAANEMEERVDRLVPYGYSTVWISTFHSFGDRLLRDNALASGLNPDFKVLSLAESAIFLREHVYDLPLERYRPSGNPTKHVFELVRYFGRLKDEDVVPEEYIKYASSLPDDPADFKAEQIELASSYAAYLELMAKNGYLDFGDQVTMALKLLRTRPTVLKRYTDRFKYVLADEFQDTNYAQFELVKLLAGGRRNITVVADDDQSIYKFRGAAISNVLNFKTVFPDAAEITLRENYRSVQPILDASYRLITHNNPDRLEIKSGIDKRLVSIRDGGAGAVKHLFFDTVTSEAETIARMIKEACASKKRRLSDFALLVRTNGDAEPYLKALTQSGIDHRFSGSSGLYSRPEIMHLIAFLRAVTNHMDSLSLFHLASSAPYGLKAEELIPCHNLSRRTNRPLYIVMRGVSEGITACTDLDSKSIERVKACVDDVKRYSELSLTMATGRLLYAFVTESGILSSLSSEATEEAEFKVRNIAKFFDMVTHIEETLKVKNAHALIEHLNLLMEAGDDPSTAEPDLDAECVQVMTVHKSKGLEFPVVFMAGLVTDRFPRRGRKDPIEMPAEIIKDILPSGDSHIAEERRLFYVGMTRAMEELYLTGAADYGGVRAKKTSRFVLEALDAPQASPLIKTSASEAIKRHAPPPAAGHIERAPLPDDTVIKLTPYEVDDYATCPLKYRYVHVLKVPLLPHHTVMYGSAMHAAIRFYFERKMDNAAVFEDDILSIFKSAWRNEGFVSREHEEKRMNEGIEALRRFFKKQESKEGIKPVCVEKPFLAEFGKFSIAGRWDLIEERGGGAHIIDFKTSDVRSVEKAVEKAEKSLQLKLYALGYRAAMGKLPSGCELHFVDHDVVGSVVFTDKDMDKTVSELEKTAEGIRKREFTAKPEYLSCSWCAFNNFCEFSAV